MSDLELVKELRGIVCRCGAPKRTKETFCGKCYYALPLAKRRALYNHLGEGYREAYEDAIKTLEAQ